MGGLFGVVDLQNCVQTLFYGTDYHSHLGTEHGGMAVFGAKGFYNTIHGISQAQFKSRFVDDYKKMEGHSGIGAIEDESPQPLIFHSKFGRYAVVASGLLITRKSLPA
jgi:amidophosphoribosyltransferase